MTGGEQKYCWELLIICPSRLDKQPAVQRPTNSPKNKIKKGMRNKRDKAWNRSSSVSWPASAAASLSLIGKSLSVWIARERPVGRSLLRMGSGYTLSNGVPPGETDQQTDSQASSRLTKKTTTAKPNQHAAVEARRSRVASCRQLRRILLFVAHRLCSCRVSS